MNHIKTFGIASLAIALFASGVLFNHFYQFASAHGGNTGLVHSCVKNSSGAPRIVEAGEPCNGNETALDWPAEMPLICTYCDISWPEAIYFVANGNYANSILNYSMVFDGNFSGANFTNAKLIGFSFRNDLNVDFTNADFSGADLRYGVFVYSTVGTIPFIGANFTGTNMLGVKGFDTNVDFTGAIWSNTTCPDGTNSDNNANTCEGHLTP